MTFLLIGLGVGIVIAILFAVASCRMRRFATLVDQTNKHKLD